MEKIFTQSLANMTPLDFIRVLEEAGYEIVPAKKTEKSFLTGVKELASFLHMSISTAQRKISSGEFDFCSYRTGQIILFDKEKLLEGLKADKPIVRKYRKRSN